MRPGLDSDLDLAAAARTALAASERQLAQAAALTMIAKPRPGAARGRIASELHSGSAGMGGAVLAACQ